MNDYISREAAIKCICSGCFEGDMKENGFCGIPCDDYKRISNIPAADVRPVVKGFWVEENGEDAHTGELWCIWKCSECGARRTAGWRHTQDGRNPRDNYCPNCGADMREGG